jgi:hypothetical protein
MVVFILIMVGWRGGELAKYNVIIMKAGVME